MTAAAAAYSAAPTADPRRWKALGVLLVVQFMLVLDISVVAVALPTIEVDLGFSRAGITWVVDAYVLVAGSLLLLGGRLGDVLGRRRMFLAGVAIFAVASIACGAARNPATLVVSRLVQGGGEALAGPAAFGLIALLFTASAERTKAIGFFGAVSGIAGTSGPILSGLLVEYASWRWIFFLNIPIAVIAIVTVPRLVGADGPTGSDTSAADADDPGAGAGTAPTRGVDLPGAALATAAFGGIVYAAIEAADHAWSSARVLVPLLAGFVLLAAFVAVQRLVANPLLPLRFLAERTRVVTNLVSLLFYAVFLTQFFITTLYLQDVLGFSPLRAGLAFLPFGAAIGMSIGIGTALLPRLGLRPVVAIGLAVMAAGFVLFTRITAGSSFAGTVLPASVVIALGSGLCLPSLSNGAVHRVTARDAGLASGLQQAVQQVGGAVGLAVLSTVALRHATGAVARGAPPSVALAAGYVTALRVGAVVLVAAAVLAVALLRRDTSNAGVEHR